MTARKRERPLATRLAALSEAVTQAKQRVRECQLAHGRAEADVARLRDAVIDAHADGDDARAAKASRERATLERDGLPDAVERLEGARRALQRAEVEVGTFAMEHLDGLLSELRPDAVRVAEAVETAVEQLERAHAEWNAVDQRAAGLLRLAGRKTGTLTRFPAQLEALVRDARRAAGTPVPPPGLGEHAPPARVREAA
jgi:hypothetical protein